MLCLLLKLVLVKKEFCSDQITFFLFFVCDFWRHNKSKFDFDYANEHNAMLCSFSKLNISQKDTII